MKMRIFISIVLLLVCSVIAAELPVEQPPMPLVAEQAFRPPAVPLVACDPSFSIWSCGDKLTDDVTRHWSGKPMPLTCLARIDGKTYRVMGVEPAGAEAMHQINLKVWPTMTTCVFRADGVEITLTFLQAALPNKVNLLSKPIAFVSIDTTYFDNQSHEVSVYFDAAMEIVESNSKHQENHVDWEHQELDRISVLSCESQVYERQKVAADKVLTPKRQFFMASQKMNLDRAVIAPAVACRTMFMEKGEIPKTLNEDMPCKLDENAPVMAMKFDDVFRKKLKIAFVFNDMSPVYYYGKPVQRYWRRNGADAIDLVREGLTRESDNFVEKVRAQCEGFNIDFLAEIQRVGGRDYVLCASLAHRQGLGAHLIVADDHKMPLMFNTASLNGADLLYSFAPQILLLNPTLVKASLIPILDESRVNQSRISRCPQIMGDDIASVRYVRPWGDEPINNPAFMDQSAGLILLVAAVVEAEGHSAFAEQYWDLLTVWAENIKTHSDKINNTNRGVKSIAALGAYAKMAKAMRKQRVADEYRKAAEAGAKGWLQKADDGDHYRMAFDMPGTWSQKPDLVWDRLLELGLFGAEVAQKEMAYYKKMSDSFGLPLDGRSKMTRLDKIYATACITGQVEDFQQLIMPVYQYLQNTPDRVPMSPKYNAGNAKQDKAEGSSAVGGVFIKLLEDKTIWKKWVLKADKSEGQWAPIPARTQ